ncbi:MAG: putative endonuclease [Planctomycetota bacterium]|jgi:putative endonuclease
MPTPSPWYLYFVRCGDGALYAGIAIDPKRRLAEHAGDSGRGAKYLRGRGPLKMVFKRKLPDRSAALRMEYAVKRLPKERKESLVKGKESWPALKRSVLT